MPWTGWDWWTARPSILQCQQRSTSKPFKSERVLKKIYNLLPQNYGESYYLLGAMSKPANNSHLSWNLHSGSNMFFTMLDF